MYIVVSFQTSRNPYFYICPVVLFLVSLTLKRKIVLLK